MGMKGLHTFITKESGDISVSNIDLKNTKLIIDGSNFLLAFFCGGRDMRFLFGGDYDKIYDCCSKFFQRLQKCNIDAIVFIDETSKRNNKVIGKNEKIIEDLFASKRGAQDKIKCKPHFLRDVFIGACNDFGMKVHRSFGEVAYKGQLFILSKEMNCPIATQNADFFLFDVDVIPLSEILDNVIRSNGTILVKKYCRNKLLHHFNIRDEKVIYLLPCILKDTFLPKDVLKRFLKQVPLANMRGSHRQRQIQGVFEWLGHRKDYEDGLEKILATVPTSQRDSIKEKIEKYGQVFDREHHSVSKEVKSLQGNVIPHWMMNKIWNGQWHRFHYDVLVNRVHFTDVLIEDKGAKSAGLFSLDIYKTISGHLVSLVDNDFPIVVKFDVRKGKDLLEEWVEIASAPEASMAELRSGDIQAKEEFLMDLVNLPQDMRPTLRKAEAKLRCFLLGLFFWAGKSQPPISDITIRVLAATYLMKKNTDALSKPLQRMVNQWSKYDKSCKHNSLQQVYNLANLQTSLKGLNSVLDLIDHEEIRFQPSCFWNGTLMFNMENAMKYENYKIEFPQSLGQNFQDTLDLFKQFCPNVANQVISL